MIGEYFDADPRHGGVPSRLTVAFTQQHVGDGWGDAGATTSTGSAGSTNSDCSWRPDLSYSTPKAKSWLQSDKQLNAQPLNVDANGMYTVQFGDCLSGIAARQLRGQGNGSPDKDDIADEVSQIVQANHDRYPSLNCNTDLVKTGWQLLIPSGDDGATAAAPPPPERQPVQPPPPERLPQPDEQEQPERPAPPGACPDNGGNGRPTVNEYHINNAYFDNQGRMMPDASGDNGYDRGDRGGWQQSMPPGDQWLQQRPYAPYIEENPVWIPRNYYANPGLNFEMGLFPRHRMPMPMPWRPPFRHGGGGGGRFSIGIGIW